METEKSATPKKESKAKDGKGKGGKIKKEKTADGEIPVRIFGSAEEQGATQNQNTIEWKATLGQGFECRVQRWHSNGKMYINFRKQGNVGANVPIDLYENLLQALAYMKKDVPQFF